MRGSRGPMSVMGGRVLVGEGEMRLVISEVEVRSGRWEAKMMFMTPCYNKIKIPAC